MARRETQGTRSRCRRGTACPRAQPHPRRRQAVPAAGTGANRCVTQQGPAGRMGVPEQPVRTPQLPPQGRVPRLRSCMAHRPGPLPSRVAAATAAGPKQAGAAREHLSSPPRSSRSYRDQGGFRREQHQSQGSGVSGRGSTRCAPNSSMPRTSNAFVNGNAQVHTSHCVVV